MIDASQRTHGFSFLLSICVEEQRSKQKVFYLKLKLCKQVLENIVNFLTAQSHPTTGGNVDKLDRHF